jgi:peptidyl-prolyl cis-trans isomerase C
MQNRLYGAVLALVMISTLASACRKGAASAETKSDAPAAAEQPPQPPKPVPQTLPDVVARVNGEAVTKGEFEKFINQLEMNAGGPVPPDRRDEIFRNALDGLVNLKLLSQEVKSRAVTGDEQVVAEEIKKIRSRFPTEEEFNKALAAKQMTAEKLQTEMRTQLGINKLMESEASSASPVTDTDVKDYYDKNPERFKKPEQVRASHILFKTEGDEAAKKKARASAETVLKQAKSGKDFAALAKEHSSDGSAQQGGDLGFFVKEQMVAEFSNAAFAMQPGQISDIVESQFGYHIIKVTERKAPETVALDQVSPQVKQFLTQQRQKERADTFMKQLRSKAKIEVLI